MKTLPKKILPIIFLIAISSWPIFLYLHDGYTIYANSQLNFSLPLRYHAVRTILNGDLPLWNSNFFNGMSLIGDTSSLPFDPFGLLLVFLNPVHSFVLLPAVQLFLAGFFMYLYLLKGLRLGRLAALLGGSLYVFSPILIFGKGAPLDNHLPVQGILLLPLILFFIEKAIQSKGAKITLNSIFAGFFLAVDYFSTLPNMAFFVAVFIFCYLLFHGISFRKKIRILFTVAIVAFLLMSIQLFPTMEVVKESHRTHLWQPAQSDYHGYSFLSLALSFFHGAFRIFEIPKGRNPFYLGIFNFLLLILSYRFRTAHNSINAYKKLLILFLLMMIGFYYLPLKGLVIKALPFFRGVAIGNMSFLLYFCAFVLISQSFNKLVSRPEKEKDNISLWTALIFIILTSIGFIIIIGLHYSKFQNFYIEGGLPSFYIVSYCLFLLGSFGLLIFLLRRGRYRRIITGCLFLLIVGHLFLIWNKTFPPATAQLKDLFKKTTETEFLEDMSPLERMEIYYGEKRWKWNQVNLKQGLTLNLPLFFGASISGGQLMMHSYRDRILFDAINGRYPFRKEWYWKDGRYIRDSGRVYLEEKALQNQHLINLLGIDYIFSAEELKKPSLKEVARGESYFIYKNLEAHPRGFIVYRQKILNNDDEILDVIVDNRADLRKTVLCERPILNKAVKNENIGYLESKIEFEEYLPNFIRLHIQTPYEGVLVLTDSYDEGWKAYEDGCPRTIHRVNYKFRGIRVSPGEHTVTFRYLPVSFLFGAIISSVSLLSFSVIVIFLTRFCSNKRKLKK